MHQTIVIADDHRLFSSALAELIQKSNRFEVLYEVANGSEIIERFNVRRNIPDIVLLDINMPVMDGFETALWIKSNHPEVKVLALTMNNDEESIVRMIKAGARGYVLKDMGPSELEKALDLLCEKGVYYSELVTQSLVKAVSGGEPKKSLLTEREKEFLNLACSELTYKEISEKMFLSLRTVDGYREALFEKLQVRSRVGLVLYAISNKLVKI